MKKKRGFWGLLLDFILVIMTGGLWLGWIVIRYMRANSGKKRRALETQGLFFLF